MDKSPKEAKGIALAARYSFPPNDLGYCGTSSYFDIMRNYLVSLVADGENAAIEPVKTELMKFAPHYAYLSLIARSNGLSPFDLPVVRAFWTGNELLENVSHDALADFIKNDLLRSQPKRAKKLADALPNGILPHHSFNPLYINFVTDKVARTIENYDACCISAGTVRSVSSDATTAIVQRNAIVSHAGALALAPKSDVVSLETHGLRFIEAVPKPGDILSIHWGMTIEKLSEHDAKNLEFYTRKTIDAINAAR